MQIFDYFSSSDFVSQISESSFFSVFFSTTGLPARLAAFAFASASSCFTLVEMAHFFTWIRTLSSPVSKVMVSSVA